MPKGSLKALHPVSRPPTTQDNAMKHPVKQALALLAAAAALWQPAQAQDIDPNLRDAMQVNHYLPGGDRHLFGAARGSVKNIDYRIHPFSATATGPVLPLMHERTGFDADLKYETHFSNHGYEVHDPFDNHNSRSEEKHYGGVTDGFTVYTLKYTGHEHHPADGYDGPQGGGYPAPKGARDIYTYKISGTATKTKIIPPSNDSFVQRYWQDNAQVIPNGIQRHEEAGKLLTDFDNNKGLWGNTMQAIRGGLIAGTNFLTTGLNGASAAIGINTATDMGGEYGGYYAARSYFAARRLTGGQEGLASAVKSMQESAFAVQGLKSRASEWAKNNPATAETLKAATSVAETAALAAGRKIEIPNPFGRGKTNIAPPPSVPHPAHPDNNIGMNNANYNAELQQKISNNNGTPKTAPSGESKSKQPPVGGQKTSGGNPALNGDPYSPSSVQTRIDARTTNKPQSKVESKPKRNTAPEHNAGELTKQQFDENVKKYLGEGYEDKGKGRFLSKDGMRQTRYGDHETRNPNDHHGHFEAYDKSAHEGGEVIENSRVVIKP